MKSLQAAHLFGVQGKKVLITGGGRGIGLMIARGFVANGAHVFISSRDAEACQTAATELTAAGPGSCVALPEDLSSVAACERLAARLSELAEALHVLVNNSGVAWGEPLERASEKGFDKVFALNVKALFFLTKALLPLLTAGSSAEDPARVINIGSIAGLQNQPFPTFFYDASKAAVHHLTRKLADELASKRGVGKRITVNAIAPGYVPSRMSAGLEQYTQPGAEDKLARIPLARLGNGADMAGAALFLASPAGSWITGIVLPVDGGYLAKL
jgi:NAD(P)-dependent dehydrogenase (short-subunit alcohol dehydrogenase family)